MYAVTRVWLGFDPGGRQTGIVVRRRNELLAVDVVVRNDDLTMPDGRYTRAVTGSAVTLLERAGLGPRDPTVVVVSEGVRYWPQGRRGDHTCPVCGKPHDPTTPRNLTGLLGTAIVHGAIVERWSDTVVVPPGKGHGSLHESAYPKPIRPAGKGHDLLRHCRAAWDCTHHGETLFNRRDREVAST